MIISPLIKNTCSLAGLRRVRPIPPPEVDLGDSWSSYMPQNLIATLITGGVQLDWTLLHNPEALQIYYSSNGVNYSCLAFAVLGTAMTYNHYFDGGVTAYYKLRSYQNGVYTSYTNVVSITVPDTDAEAIIARMMALSETPTTARKANIRTTIASLKTAELYNEQFDGLLINRGHAVESAKLNLINQYDNITWVEKFEGNGADESFIHCVCELSNGDLLLGAGNNIGHYYRSVDKGENWTDEGVLLVGEGTVYNICDLSGGIVLAGTGQNGKILRSTDYGYTWIKNTSVDAIWAAKGAVAEHQYIVLIEHLGNGIVIATSENSPTPATSTIFRSIDYGLTWTDVGQAGTDLTVLNCLCNVGGGIVLVGGGRDEGAGVFTADAHMIRSIDYGEHWTDLGHVCPGQVRLCGSAYLGNGIVVVGTTENACVIRSTNYGLTWNSLGIIKNTEKVVAFILSLDECKALACTASGSYNGIIFSSDDYGATWVNRGIPEAGHGIVEIKKISDNSLICYSSTAGASGGKVFKITGNPFIRKSTNDYDLLKAGVGILTFVEDIGFNSDGSTTYLRSGFIPNNAIAQKFKQDDACFGFKISGNLNTGWLMMGGQHSAGTPICYFATKISTEEYYIALNGNAVTVGVQPIAIGYNNISRLISTIIKQFVNDNTYDITSNSTGVLDVELYLLATYMYPNPYGFFGTNTKLEAVWIGKGMTQSKFLTFQGIMNAYMAAL